MLETFPEGSLNGVLLRVNRSLLLRAVDQCIVNIYVMASNLSFPTARPDQINTIWLVGDIESNCR